MRPGIGLPTLTVNGFDKKLTTAQRVYDMQFVTTYPNNEADVLISNTS